MVEDIEERYKIEKINIDVLQDIIMQLEIKYDKAKVKILVIQEEINDVLIKNYKLKIEIDELMIINLQLASNIKHREVLMNEDQDNEWTTETKNDKEYFKIEKLYTAYNQLLKGYEKFKKYIAI